MDPIKRYRIADAAILSTVSIPFFKYVTTVEQFILFITTVFSYNYFMFSFNDFMDKDKDYHDLEKRKRNPFLHQEYKTPAIIMMSLSGLVLVATGLLTPPKAYINVILFLIAFSYSAGVRAKNKPFLDVIIHGAWIVGMIVYAISFFNLSIGIKESMLLFQYIITSTALELSQGIRDYVVDKETKENTTVVYIGLNSSKIVYATLIFLFAIGTPFFIENVYVKYLSLLAIPLFYFTRQETFEQRAIIINLFAIFSTVVYLL